MAIRRKVGGNTKKLTVNPGARSSIKANQKTELKNYKYDLQAKVRQDISGPHVGAVASQGRLSSFKLGPRNTAKTSPAITKPKKKRKKK